MSVGIDAEGGHKAYVNAPSRTYADFVNTWGLQRGDQVTFVTVQKLDGRYEVASARILLNPRNADGSGAPMTTEIVNSAGEAMLNEAGKTVTDFGGIMPNPTLKKVQEGQQLARETKADLILAVGGGSVSDCCKIMASPPAPLQGERGVDSHAIPLGVVVTASGTGSEQNNGAVITDEEKKVKGAMWGVFADFAILDPDLTKTVPMKQVISGAFDTLSHCMETYFGHPHTCNLSDRINEAVQRSVIKNLKALIANPDDDFARSELMWASAMGENGILKLGKVTDFQCHMIEHQLGAYTDCNHGQGLAVLHPVLYRHIYKSAEEKFRRWAQEVWLVQDADEGIDFLADFIREIGLPTTLTEMGIALDDATTRAIADSTIITPGCCKQLTADELMEILEECQ